MKKSFKILSVILCLMLALFAFTACSDSGAPDYSTSNPQYAVSEQKLEIELSSFLDTCSDRTSFTIGEEFAARYLQQRLIDFGYANTYLNDFVAEENDVSNLLSQNVVAKYEAANKDENTKNVILGAYYDNRYGEAYKDATAYKSEGALANGTGVATLLVIAEYLAEQKPQLSFDVTIVFFGGSFVTDAGAQAYYKEMTREERANTVLMVELQRLGVDHVYAFSDARETRRESFFDGIAEENGLDIYKITQKSPLVTNASAFDGVPYYQWAHSGVFGVFFDAKIPTLNLVGANWETIDMTDSESANNDNISYTSNDNLTTLRKLYPNYAQKMASAATLVIRSLESEKFLSVMEYDKANFPNTDILTMRWVWYLVTLCIIIIAVIVLMIVVTHLSKKYPVVMPQPKRMKMAVFGMDYEDKNSSDIFIDIKDSPSVNDDIFPGVPNNDSVLTGTPFDEIFAPLFGATLKPESPAPENTVTQSESAHEKNEAQNTEQEVSGMEKDEQAEKETELSETSTAEKQDRTPPQKEQSAESKKQTQKRKTTSAGKSVAAKKTTRPSGTKSVAKKEGSEEESADEK